MMELRSFRISVRDEPCSAFSVSLSNLSSVSRLIDVNPSGTFNPVMGDVPCSNARSCKAERRMAHGLSSAVTPRLKARERSNPGYWWWAGRRDFGHAPRDRSRWFLRSRSSRRRRRMRALLACVATMNTATHSATSTTNGVSMASPAGRLRLLAGLECSELFLRLCCALHKQGLNIGQKLSCQF